MKFYQDIIEAHPNSKIYDKCWDGHRKVPGKTRGEKGSCKKISNEAYDAWDEADVWYQFDATTKKLKQKTWYHAQEREARANGWHDSHDKAMRAHGYFPSKFKKGEYVIKGADDKWIKVYPYADKTVKEFAPAGRDPWGDDQEPGDDPYKSPKPKAYGRSIDFFGQFEADHFDKEDMNDATGVFKGYWDYDGDMKQIAYFKFDNPTATGSDDPGMGWYYEPQNESVAEGSFGQNVMQYPRGSVVADKHGNRYTVLGHQGRTLVVKGVVDGKRVMLFPHQLQQGVAEGSLEEIDRRGFLKGLGAAAVAGAAGGAQADRFWQQDELTKQWQGQMTSETFKGAVIHWDEERKIASLALTEPTNFSINNVKEKRLYFPKITSNNFTIKIGDSSPFNGTGSLYTFPLRQLGDYRGNGLTLFQAQQFSKVRDEFINADKVIVRVEIDSIPTTIIFHDNPGLIQQRQVQKSERDKQAQRQKELDADNAKIRANLKQQVIDEVIDQKGPIIPAIAIAISLPKGSPEFKTLSGLLRYFTQYMPGIPEHYQNIQKDMSDNESVLGVSRQRWVASAPSIIKKLSDAKEKIEAYSVKESVNQGVAEDNNQTGVKAGIYQSDVYGVKAYHSKCLEKGCDWESRRYDRIKQAQDAAKKHAQTHIKPGVAEGTEFGAYYYEQLAQKVFDADPTLNNDDAILNNGYAIAKKELGARAQGIFNAEDFAGDFVSAYAWLQKQAKDKKITKETQAVTDNSLGYKNTLAVMKAADSSQEATINLGGEPVTLDYPEARFIAGKYKAFLRAGRQEEFFGLVADPAKFDGMMKQLRNLIDKQKNFKGSVPGERGVDEVQARESTDYEKSIPAGADEGRVKWKCPSCGVASGIAAFRTNNYKCPSCKEPLPVKGQMGLKHLESVSEQGVAEGDVDSPVAGAVTRRIMSQRLDLLKQYGPKLVMAAIDDVADYVGDVEEIGSSDVSAWVTQVERMLKENPPQAFAESLRLVGKHGEGAKTAKVYKDHEWGEYRVKFYSDGKHEGESADYHTDDRDDANDTAKSWISKGKQVVENTYWCRQEKTRKLIPEGYKKTAKGYITKL